MEPSRTGVAHGGSEEAHVERVPAPPRRARQRHQLHPPRRKAAQRAPPLPAGRGGKRRHTRGRSAGTRAQGRGRRRKGARQCRSSERPLAAAASFGVARRCMQAGRSRHRRRRRGTRAPHTAPSASALHQSSPSHQSLHTGPRSALQGAARQARGAHMSDIPASSRSSRPDAPASPSAPPPRLFQPPQHTLPPPRVSAATADVVQLAWRCGRVRHGAAHCLGRL